MPRSAFVTSVVLVLATALGPGAAQAQSVPGVLSPPGTEITLIGVIVTLERGQSILQLEERSGERVLGLWTVRLLGDTRVKGQRSSLHSDDEEAGVGVQAVGRLLRRGDLVLVAGQLAGSRVIVAREIILRGRGGGVLSPPPGQASSLGQTIIIAPAQNAEITAAEFQVIGRTVPGAQVRVEVSAGIGGFGVKIADGTVLADSSGIFVFPVRPRLRVPGTVYTITVTPTIQGRSGSPVSVTVRQR